MPKHRGTVYAVVREDFEMRGDHYVFGCIIGVYHTLMRAEEVAGASKQQFIDAGMTHDEYIFSVKATTWYDE